MEWLLPNRIWLRGNLTWGDVSSLAGYPKPNHLLYAFPMALLLFVVRYLCESFLYLPLGRALGLKCKSQSVEPNAILEEVFKTQEDMNIKALAEELQWPIKQVEVWFYRRKKLNKASTLKKFSECLWRCTFYSCVAVYATWMVWKKPWFWHPSLLFEKGPQFQELTNDVWWYYSIELGFYVSLMYSQFTDVIRKDFKIMFLHHVYTFVLMSGTWCTNTVRIGTLVTFIHDFSDIPLELAKCMKYLRLQKASLCFFLVFIITWIVTRLCVYPYYVYISWRDSYSYVAQVPYFVLNSLLLALFALHIIWTWMIYCSAVRAFTSDNGGPSDARSDSEDDSSSDENAKAK